MISTKLLKVGRSCLQANGRKLFYNSTCSASFLSGKQSYKLAPVFKADLGIPLLCNRSVILQPSAFFHFTAIHRAFNEVEKSEEFCISHDDLKSSTENDQVQIIDVRRADEVAEGYIHTKRNIHIPVQEVAEAFQLSDEDFKEKYGVDKPLKDASDIVFHCKMGGRSTFAMRIAQNLGYSKARHYPGGWSEWSEKNQ